VDGIGTKDKKIENIAKELADILYTVYGTILEHGLQDKIEEIFAENHRSQMSKEYSPEKMIKGKKFKEASIKKILE
jgi:predicted HAD superfamily Cof-like phosphohydrolase